MVKTRTRFALRPKLVSVAIAAALSTGTALANPTGANVVRGTAAIHQAGNLLQITNSPNAIINWQSFSIGANEITRFIQQSPSSAVLNRVTTQNPSTILGTLQSNGRVFLINPNGIVFGKGSKVDVGGLVASSLRLSDAAFLAGKHRYTEGLGKAVVNQGAITSSAGESVYLVGADVTNQGIIRSPQGDVVLAAGKSVELVNPGTPNLRVKITAPKSAARNLGQIIAEAGRIGIYAGLIQQSGTLRADSAVAEGGRIVLKATKSVTLEDTSVLSAQGQGGGEILVLAGEGVQVAGRLDASAPSGGNGGFIETSGKQVKIADSTVITTHAASGKTGVWLIDPEDFRIAPQGGDMTGTALSAQLAQTSVVITSDQGRVSQGAGNGDIFVFDQITWTAPNDLTLLARRNISLNTFISGGGDLAFLAGWNGNLQSPAVTSGIGDITSSFDSIATQGSVRFVAGRDILLGASAVTAGSGALDGLSKTANLVAGRNINLTAPDGGASVLATGNNGSSATVILQAISGAITMAGSELSATGGGLASLNGGAAEVTLSAGSAITLNNSIVSAIGAGGLSGGSGAATLTAGGGITISGSTVSATGGAASIGAGGNATVKLVSGGDISLASSVNAAAGVGSPAGTAKIFLTFLTSTGNFSVNGVPGIVGTGMGRVCEGFCVNGLLAIPDVNFFVIKPSDTPAFVNTLVASVNQQVDVLADQLKAGNTGEVGEDKDKRKLPFCDS